MPVTEQVRAAGGVVYSHTPAGELHFALIFDKHGNWGLPKGKLDPGEDEVQAARREIAEETGLHCEIGPLVERITYPIHKNGTWQTKVIDYFLAPTSYVSLAPRLEEGITQARWVDFDTALNMVAFDQTRSVLQRALEMLAA
jgi:8-oxo-dGTP diphosphatase